MHFFIQAWPKCTSSTSTNAKDSGQVPGSIEGAACALCLSSFWVKTRANCKVFPALSSFFPEAGAGRALPYRTSLYLRRTHFPMSWQRPSEIASEVRDRKKLLLACPCTLRNTGLIINCHSFEVDVDASSRLAESEACSAEGDAWRRVGRSPAQDAEMLDTQNWNCVCPIICAGSAFSRHGSFLSRPVMGCTRLATATQAVWHLAKVSWSRSRLGTGTWRPFSVVADP